MKINTRKHLERAQPAARRKYGLLEKHKDYKLRATDYAKKQARLKILKEKARFRNEDEFYHAMINAFINKKGIHVDTKQHRINQFDAETMKLLKSQDLKYVAYHKDINKKRIGIIKNELKSNGIIPPVFDSEGHVAVEVEQNNRHHIKFVESLEEAESLKSHSKLSIAKKHEEDEQEEDLVEDDKQASIIEKLLVEMKSRYQRLEALEKTEAELQIQKNMMSKGRRYKVGTDSRGNAVYKWRQERAK